ncbi:hypothetical protein ES704_01804 [subsurface metagenome]|jgi:hypothetical protein
MPEIGEIRKPQDIGKKSSNRFIWHACVDCGKERWVQLKYGKPDTTLCRNCAAKRKVPVRGNKTSRWKGGKHRNSQGYIEIRIYPDDFFYPMANKAGYVREHRLVVAKALGRCLLPWEVVHHKGTKYPLGSKENKSDNRYPENLELLPDKRWHLIDSTTKAYIKHLEKENALLKLQLEALVKEEKAQK